MLDASDYPYRQGAQHNHAHAYLLPVIYEIVRSEKARRAFDLGCGNGDTVAALAASGIEAIGVDPSAEGIELAKEKYPHCQFALGSAYDDLRGTYGTFPFVVSLEVVEHLYSPRRFAATLFDLVRPGGIAVVSTPYHSYWKNLALAVTGRMDAHFTALWENGHIKFWSRATLRTLLERAGFADISFRRVGRVPLVAKSMIALARKPATAS